MAKKVICFNILNICTDGWPYPISKVAAPLTKW